MSVEFSKELIKGKIAEIIFEQMFRESKQYDILRFGYEYTLPELAQYQDLFKNQNILDDIRHTPDFILISQNKEKVYLVEIKYRSKRDESEIKEVSEKLLKNWTSPWLFVASPDGFFFEPCHTIVKNNGKIGSLFNKWVNSKIQEPYLKMLNEFVAHIK